MQFTKDDHPKTDVNVEGQIFKEVDSQVQIFGSP